MLKVTFYCDITNEDGEIIESDFDFDTGVFDNREELDKYMKNSGYVVGEPCAQWGDDIGILRDLFIDEGYTE